jgi:hypothetical protein
MSDGESRVHKGSRRPGQAGRARKQANAKYGAHNTSRTEDIEKKSHLQQTSLEPLLSQILRGFEDSAGADLDLACEVVWSNTTREAAFATTRLRQDVWVTPYAGGPGLRGLAHVPIVFRGWKSIADLFVPEDRKLQASTRLGHLSVVCT